MSLIVASPPSPSIWRTLCVCREFRGSSSRESFCHESDDASEELCIGERKQEPAWSVRGKDLVFDGTVSHRFRHCEKSGQEKVHGRSGRWNQLSSMDLDEKPTQLAEKA